MLLAVINTTETVVKGVGLIAQLVEHCTSICEVMGSNHVQLNLKYFQT